MLVIFQTYLLIVSGTTLSFKNHVFNDFVISNLSVSATKAKAFSDSSDD